MRTVFIFGRHVARKKLTFSLKWAFATAIAAITFSQARAQSPGQNYVQTTIPAVGVHALSDIDTMSYLHKQTQIDYMDGLGRAIQKVMQSATVGPGAAIDLVTQTTIYDALGRPYRTLLPFTDGSNSGAYRPNGQAAASTFYAPAQAAQNKVVTTPFPFSEVGYEASPLNRILEKGAPGASWQLGTGHTILTAEHVNVASQVGIWTVTGNGASQSGYYLPGTLSYTVVTDENGNTKTDFQDFQGKVISRRFALPTGSKLGTLNETYYIYNQLMQLAYVLPPAAMTNLSLSSLSAFTESSSSSLFQENIYAYHYDGRGRVVEKKIPGKGWEYIVYNKLDQIVLTQDSLLRKNKQWLFVKYDSQGRTTGTGIYYDAVNVSRAAIQTFVNAQTALWEERLGQANYPGTAFPQTVKEQYTINYYDDYNYTGASGKVDYIPFSGTQFSLQINGKLTGQKNAIIGAPSNGLLKKFDYDVLDRLISTSEDQENGGILFSSPKVLHNTANNIDFAGRILQTNNQYVNLPVNLTNSHRYSYNQLNQQQYAFEQINGDAEVLLVKSEYNPVGQLIRKNIDSIGPGIIISYINENSVLSTSKIDIARDSINLLPGFSFAATSTSSYVARIDAGSATQFAQGIDYRYNERGWLKSINNAALANDGGVTNSDTNDLFGEELTYQDRTDFGAPQYNGNIAGVSWRTAVELIPGAQGLKAGTQGYKYSYDALDRLIKSQFGTPVTGAWTWGTKNGEAPTYDIMGNILTLSRTDTNSNTINSLTYKYLNSGNKLSQVVDAGTRLQGSTYTYDGNGNLVTDLNKGLAFFYNPLGLVSRIVKGTDTLIFGYDGDGNKLYKTLKGKVNLNRDYTGELELVQGNIEFLHTDAGRALPGSGYTYEFFMQDHLGNTRAAFQQPVRGSLKITQFQNYYPSGLDLAMGTNSSPIQAYKYNQKEFEGFLSLNQYDYGARFYDPVIARWTTIDRFAEKYRDFTPYNYVLNNPIKGIDVNGDTTVVLLAPYGASGLGHMAILIQSGGMYHLYSKNGTNEHNGLYGPNDKTNPAGHKGNDVGDDKGFKSPKEFLDNSEYNPVSHTGEREYTKGFIIPTTKTEDEKAIVAAIKELNKDYDARNANCANTVQAALGAAGKRDGTLSPDEAIFSYYVPIIGLIINGSIAIPNTLYRRLQYENDGTVTIP